MNTHRYIARIILLAETPLFVGSGSNSLLTDALVQKDFNGLPMIAGTSLTGVLRHSILDAFDLNSYNDELFELMTIFGNQFHNSKEVKEKEAFEKYYKIKFGNKEIPKGYGARLRVSSAYLMLNTEQTAEGVLENVDNAIKVKYDILPTRQHVKINDKGVAIKGGLFDNEVVYKGTRFKFEIELIGNESDQKNWTKILNTFTSPLYRLGQGTRNGYGNLKIYSLKSRVYNLPSKTDFESYSDFNPSLNDDSSLLPIEKPISDNKIVEYLLNLKPDSGFFIFSEGFGDEQVDNKPFEEEVAVYRNNTIEFDKQTVIPASSIKGALSHRTAFHYNKLKKNWAETLNTADPKARECQIKLWTGAFNDAVANLFGAEMGHEKVSGGERGHVIIDDLYFNENEIKNKKIFNHVAIDRFTGGAMEGALFSEKVSQKIDGKIELKISLDKEFEPQSIELEAFENALIDICRGLLPLGGMTTKGHGIFTGTLFKNGVKIYSYED